MNRNTLEQYILLEQSGELPARKARRLEQALAADPAARAFRDDLLRITQATRAAPLPAEVSAWTLQCIDREAGRAAHPHRAEPSPLARWQPALAYAAMAVVLAAGLWVTVLRWPQPTGQPGGLARATVDLPAALGEDGLDMEIEALFRTFASIEDPEQDEPLAEGGDLDEIARELLELKG